MTEARDDSALDRRTFLSTGLALAGAGLTRSSERAVAARRAVESEINRATDGFERYEAVVPDTLDLMTVHHSVRPLRSGSYTGSSPPRVPRRTRSRIEFI